MASGRRAENLVHFARILRRAGLHVGPRQVLDAVEAVETAGIGRREDFYWTLRATLIKRHEEHEIFDQAFHVFWRNPKLIDKMMSLMLPQTEVPSVESEEEKSRRLAEALFGETALHREEEGEIETDRSETFSGEEVLREKDFEKMSLAELAEAKTAIARLRLRMDEVRTRRTRPAANGPLIDMRATLRATLRSGGVIPLKRRSPRRRTPPLVVLCDISGSMSAYARIFLHFLHALTNDRDRVHVFLFGTRLTHVTRELKHRDVDEALARVAARVEDWDGGTRIGETLRRFNVDWARRVLGQGATVLLLTDGLDRDAGEGVAPEIARLHRSARRLIWLNPLLRYARFEPKALGVKALLPHVDEFRPVHNIASLAALADALSDAHIERKPERRAA
ncbi:MAG: VWA domain-containing protein [Alphaproteobacteria bacterium]|nr:VWA domain-containing protein [Alphaproteobacteria bacterium]MDX5415107.1 VWA domain-containing protein [Alphaproteobacteria bacterium]MDX5492298.1 VWA domain-containing protein [Alphaproteobacteria bacterium]